MYIVFNLVKRLFKKLFLLKLNNLNHKIINFLGKYIRVYQIENCNLKALKLLNFFSMYSYTQKVYTFLCSTILRFN